MKSPTTLLADRAMAKHGYDGNADFSDYREDAAKQLGVPVIDATLISRRWSYGAQAVASEFGWVGRLALRKAREIQAGGLPTHFLLAVTPTEIIAVERKLTPRGGRLGTPGPEVARWNRADLNVSWDEAGYLYNVTIESPSEDEKVLCSIGKADLSLSFLRLLADPSLMEPATARTA